MDNHKSKTVPVSLRILDKEYVVACPEEERDTLLASAQYFKKKIQEVREGGKVVSTERLAVISALNIIHEHFHYKQQNEEETRTLDDCLGRIQEKVDAVLTNAKQPITSPLATVEDVL